MYDIDPHFDIFDAHGLTLGHVDQNDIGDVGLVDAIGNPIAHTQMVGNIEMILDGQGREIGTIDFQGTHLADGGSYHIEPGPLGSSSIVNDFHPADVAHVQESPDGTALLDSSYQTIEVVRKSFGL